MKTSMEAKAMAVATILADSPTSWGKPQADGAAAYLTHLLKKGEIDATTFGQAISETCGNHSAMRQQLEKFGLLSGNAAKPAWIAEVERQLPGIINRKADKAIEVVDEKKK